MKMKDDQDNEQSLRELERGLGFSLSFKLLVYEKNIILKQSYENRVLCLNGYAKQVNSLS